MHTDTREIPLIRNIDASILFTLRSNTLSYLAIVNTINYCTLGDIGNTANSQ